MERKPLIGVIGPASAGMETLAMAEEVGAQIAEREAILVCGGLGGAMEAAARGAKRRGGMTVGIIPGGNAEEANKFIDIPIATGMGEARNVLVVRCSNAIIAIGGSFGTLSEIALALKLGVPIVALETWEVQAPDGSRPPIIHAKSPREAVERAFESIRA